MAWQQQGNLKGPAGTAATIAVGTVNTGVAGSAAQVNNSGSAAAAILNFVIPKGDKGDDGKGISIAGTVATYAALPSGLTIADAGKGYFVQADGLLYIWDGSAFPASGSGVQFQGPKGDAATVAVGTVTGGAAGSAPVVSNSGTSAAAVFNFTIPKGDAGAAASLAVGTVTTGAAGGAASVSNSGTSSAAVLDFTIPKGADGAPGANGSAWFNGTGAPGAVAGSKLGDYYLDTASGDVYKLS